MRLGTVIGRVTLSVRHPGLIGGRLLLVRPWTHRTLESGADHGPTLVVYDNLGGHPGQPVLISEGAEATRPFPQPVPIDAYAAGLVDSVFHQPQDPRA